MGQEKTARVLKGTIKSACTEENSGVGRTSKQRVGSILSTPLLARPSTNPKPLLFRCFSPILHSVPLHQLESFFTCQD